MQAIFQLRPVQLEQDVQHVLRGVGVANGKVCLEQVQSRRRAVAFGIVARRDELDDFRDVPGRSEVARDCDQHVGPIAKVMVKKAAARSPDRDTLFDQIAAAVTDAAARQALLSDLSRLP